MTPEGVTHMMTAARAFKAFNGPDIVVNNAGIQHVARLEDMPLEVGRCRSPSSPAIFPLTRRNENDRADVEQGHRAEPDGAVSRHAAGPAHDAHQGLGPHHQHFVGARPGRLGGQGPVCRGQARPCWPDQGDGARDGRLRHYLQRHLPGLGAHPACAEAD